MHRHERSDREGENPRDGLSIWLHRTILNCMALDRKRTLFIGIPCPENGMRQSTFSNMPNINELNLIIWNPETLVHDARIQTVNQHGQRQPIREELWDTFKQSFDTKVNEILSWINDGHVLVLAMPYQLHMMTVGLDNGTMQDLMAHSPFDKFSLYELHGELISTEPSFEDFSSHAELLKYDYVISGENFVPVFRSASSKQQRSQVVGGLIRIGKGALFFSPTAKQWNDAGLLDYYATVARLPELLTSKAADLPTWTRGFQSRVERNILSRISGLEDEIAKLCARREKETASAESEQALKLLFAGTGESLVATVGEALQEFGLKVVHGPRPRADLLLWDGASRLAAAEVKGLDGSAREHNLRQAERWAADVRSTLVASPEERQAHPELVQYAETLRRLGIDVSEPCPDLDCRALMIIGTFRQMPLPDRPPESFPDTVARAIQRSRVCALTGLDLYCFLQELKIDPTRKPDLVDKLFCNNGPISAKDWHMFISEKGAVGPEGEPSS